MPSNDSGCPDCGHPLMEHGASGCTHGLHDDTTAALNVCGCRRGRHDPPADPLPGNEAA